jgi:Asp-tRNA(Asn)/Glu-tRNA(Gln) amidotransferase A subunit family amidase
MDRGESFGVLHNVPFTITYTISLTALPAISIPCGWATSGLPIGMQLIGKPRGETALLQTAYCLQEALNFRHCWPDSLPRNSSTNSQP